MTHQVPGGLPAIQRGVGLVELMISITIGLVLVTLVTSYYLSSRQSYQTTVVTSELNDSQRYVLQALARQLMLAGYSDSWMNPNEVFPSDGGQDDAPSFADGQVITSDADDEVWIRYRRSRPNDYITHPLMTCSNKEVKEGYSIAMVRLYVDDQGRLKCQSIGTDMSTVPLLDGVNALAFSYLDSSGQFQAPSATDWSTVRAVQIDLLVETPDFTYDESIAQSYSWPGGAKKFDDRKMRSRLTRVVTLRNVESG
ncbi:PilW family protein [Halomonas sp. WWR20]